MIKEFNTSGEGRSLQSNRMERIWILAKTEFLKRYYGSILGLMWAFLNPLFQLGIYYLVFTFAFSHRIENFALFLFIGLIIYLFFVESCQKGLSVIPDKKYVLENISINKLDLFYATILSILFGFVFNLLIYFLFGIGTGGIAISFRALIFPVLVVNLLIFTLAVQLLLSVSQAYFKDIYHFWNMIKLALLWLSGVFYQIDRTDSWRSTILAFATPLPGLLQNTRALLLYDSPIDQLYLIYDMTYALILLLISLWIFQKKGKYILEKM